MVQTAANYASPRFFPGSNTMKSPGRTCKSTPLAPAAASKASRIPNTLQAVFLASNRGRDVHKPPPERVAHKDFFRNWWSSSKSNSSKASNSSRQCSANASARTSAKSTLDVSPHKSLLEKLDLPSAPLEAPVKIHKKKKKQVCWMRADASLTTYLSAFLTLFHSPKCPSFFQISHFTPTNPQPRLPTLSPQQYLDAQCRSRGYSTERYCTLKTAYHNRPTPLQIASYDAYLISLVKRGQVDAVRAMFGAGISPNPCNQYGESLLHTICRLGHAELLNVVLEAGADLEVADDYGRTPLHDACWGAEPNFACVRAILNAASPARHARLFFLTDARGAEPLTYVRREHWAAWIEFLESVKNEYWPKTTVDGDTAAKAAAPALVQQPPNSRPVKDPANALTVELARMLVSGKMTPSEVQYLVATQGEDDDDCSEYSTEDDDSEYDSDDMDDDDEDMDEEEMKAILQSLNLPSA